MMRLFLRNTKKKRRSSRIVRKQKQVICVDGNEDSEEQDIDLEIGDIENCEVFVQEQIIHCHIIIIYVSDAKNN